jgi:hypothetical protein
MTVHERASEYKPARRGSRDTGNGLGDGAASGCCRRITTSVRLTRTTGSRGIARGVMATACRAYPDTHLCRCLLTVTSRVPALGDTNLSLARSNAKSAAWSMAW